MRGYEELKKVKVSDMTGEELALFNRCNDTIKEGKESGPVAFVINGTRGFFRSISDGFVEKAEIISASDRKERRRQINEKLNDLKEIYTAGDMKESKYNLEKAILEAKLDDL